MIERGIRIALTRKSWQRIIRVLDYVIEKPHIDDLEEERDEIAKVRRYIDAKL
ncbi:hypothetical protein ES703_06136 [subsurface metagenome]